MDMYVCSAGANPSLDAPGARPLIFGRQKFFKNSFTLIYNFTHNRLRKISVSGSLIASSTPPGPKLTQRACRRHVYFTAAGCQALDLPANRTSPPFSGRISDVLLFDSVLCGQPFSRAFQTAPISDFGTVYFHATYRSKSAFAWNLIIPRYSNSRRTKDSHSKRFFAQFWPTTSALGYPKYGTPISVVGHPSLQ